MKNLAAEFDNVVKTYRTPLRRGQTVHALRGVSLGIEPGEVLALLGPNRAGKTILLKILWDCVSPRLGAFFGLAGRCPSGAHLLVSAIWTKTRCFPAT
jgi:ABC-type multidrug transport system ATPase subunit